MDALRREINSQNEWYNRFEGILERHSGQIGDLIQGLAIEIKAREKGEDSLSRAISDYTAQMKSIEKGMNWLKGAAWVISGLLALIGIPIMVAWILKMLKLT